MPVAKETFKWRIDLRSFFTYFCLLASLGLSCGIQDFWSSLQHVGSLVVACKLLVVACGYLVVVCGRKEQWPNKSLTQTYPWVSRSLWQRPGLAVACCRVQGTGPFEGGGHYLHYFHYSLASGQTIGREHTCSPSPLINRKLDYKIYGEWPHPSEQDPVSPLVSLSHQELP